MLGAVAPQSSFDPMQRAAIQAKLNDALREYRAAAAQVRQLFSRYQLNVSLFSAAMNKAKNGRSAATISLNAGEAASLVIGTMVKVEAAMKAAVGLLAVAQDARAAAVVDRTITATLQVTRVLNDLGSATRLGQSVMGGLGQSGGTIVGIAALVGILLTPMTGGAAFIVLVGGAIAYVLYQSVGALDSARTDAEAMTRDVNRICPPSGDPARQECVAMYQANYRLAAEQQRLANEGLAAAAGDAARRVLDAANPLLGPLADALPYLIAGGGVAVLGIGMYFAWPLLSGFRRGSKAMVGNRRRQRRKRKS
jgi:hypothetical protein